MWICILSLFNIIFAITSDESKYSQYTVAVQSLITLMFLVYTIALSNPFIRIFPSPVTGLGLNPILQDIGLAMHPPTLYLGYVGFSMAIFYSSCCNIKQN